MSPLTLSQLASRAGAPDTSVLRRDIQAGQLVATLYGKTYLVDEAEGERWIRDVWPTHVQKRRKPVGARRRK